MNLVATSAALAASGSLFAAAGPRVVIVAPGHTPAVGSRWNYSVTVTRAGRPQTATISEQIVDPIGGVHAVQFGTSTKSITNWPLKGTFHDFVIWPAASRGIPLTFRVIVRAGGARTIENYPVTPRR